MHKATRLRVESSRFRNNYAAKSGGAIHLRTTTEFRVSDSLFDHNQAIKSCGAALIFGVDDIQIHFTNFSRNICIKDTSSIGIDSAKYGILSGLIFYQNQARARGAVLMGKSRIRFIDSVFFENKADDCSAIVLSNSATVRVYRSTFMDSCSFSVSLTDRDTLVLKNSTFHGDRIQEISNHGSLASSGNQWSQPLLPFEYSALPSIETHSLVSNESATTEDSYEVEPETRLRGVSAAMIMTYSVAVMLVVVAIRYSCMTARLKRQESDHEELFGPKK
jgi:hypothetical protein